MLNTFPSDHSVSLMLVPKTGSLSTVNTHPRKPLSGWTFMKFMSHMWSHKKIIIQIRNKKWILLYHVEIKGVWPDRQPRPHTSPHQSWDFGIRRKLIFFSLSQWNLRPGKCFLLKLWTKTSTKGGYHQIPHTLSYGPYFCFYYPHRWINSTKNL